MTETIQQMAISVGQAAPDFTLRDQNGADVSLSDFKGQKNVVLVFYPFAFSGICTGELCEIRDNLGAFVSHDVQVLAISCDHMFSQRAWADKEAYFFPLLSDFWPHGEVARAYGVFNERAGAALRGTFLIDRDGVVAWSLVNPIGEGRDFSGYHEALKTLV
jgi:peroxiredoxin (alkyl hydroperoxide reductase subunit C)